MKRIPHPACTRNLSVPMDFLYTSLTHSLTHSAQNLEGTLGREIVTSLFYPTHPTPYSHIQLPHFVSEAESDPYHNRSYFPTARHLLPALSTTPTSRESTFVLRGPSLAADFHPMTHLQYAP